MKVWIDGSVFENSRQRGIWRVFYEIMRRTSADVDYTLWLRATPRQPIPNGVGVYSDVGRTDLARWNLPSRLRRRLSHGRDPRRLFAADVFHSTGFTYPEQANVPSLITVHDLIAESHFPISIRELEQSIPIKRQAMSRATLLPCVSRSTARELSAFYPCLAEKSRIVPHGAEHLLANETPAASSGRDVLYVGQRHGYKNFICLLDGLSGSVWPDGVNLIVVGEPFSSAESGLIKRRGLGDRIQHAGPVTDDQLRELYSGALCLVFPSFQEGFGLPCLEAQSLGCPVVCSQIPVFEEVAGDAALFFDPRLGEDLARRVVEVMDPAVRADLVEQGRENVRRFRWDDSSQKMLELYQEAART